jgi:outer membrane protein
MKMKKTILIAMMAFASFAFSQETQGNVKIGIVNGDAVIQNSIKGKRFFKKFKAFTDKKTEEIKAKVAILKQKDKDFQAKAQSMSDEKRQAMGKELQNLQTDIKRMQEDAKRESDSMFQEGLAVFQKELAPIIQNMAKEEGFDIIINDGQGSNFLFYSAKVNITGKVIELYDATVKD